MTTFQLMFQLTICNQVFSIPRCNVDLCLKLYMKLVDLCLHVMYIWMPFVLMKGKALHYSWNTNAWWIHNQWSCFVFINFYVWIPKCVTVISIFHALDRRRLQRRQLCPHSSLKLPAQDPTIACQHQGNFSMMPLDVILGTWEFSLYRDVEYEY